MLLSCVGKERVGCVSRVICCTVVSFLKLMMAFMQHFFLIRSRALNAYNHDFSFLMLEVLKY